MKAVINPSIGSQHHVALLSASPFVYLTLIIAKVFRISQRPALAFNSSISVSVESFIFDLVDRFQSPIPEIVKYVIVFLDRAGWLLLLYEHRRGLSQRTNVARVLY